MNGAIRRILCGTGALVKIAVETSVVVVVDVVIYEKFDSRLGPTDKVMNQYFVTR